MTQIRQLKDVGVQLNSGGADSESPILEFLDENGDPFMEINLDSVGQHQICIYQTKHTLSLPMSALLKGIEIAREQVKVLPLP